MVRHGVKRNRSLSGILGNVSQKERIIVEREVKYLLTIKCIMLLKETKSSETMDKLKLKWYNYRKICDFSWGSPKQKKVYQNPKSTSFVFGLKS